MDDQPLISRLNSVAWFAHVGEPLAAGNRRGISSWEEAFRFAGDEVTNWCALEASLRLYNNLAAADYERFRNWNDIARSFAKPIDQWMERATEASGVPAFPDHALTHLRSQLIGALMEEAYDDVLKVTFCRTQTELLIEGRFPCGWDVSSAEDFPDNATLLIY